MFRIFQQVLTNVERHAGATEVYFSMGVEDEGSILQISDNGTTIGRDEVAGHESLSLLAIREMALLFGARFEIEHIPGIWTTVSLRIPPDARHRDAQRKRSEPFGRRNFLMPRPGIG